jgi:hypothetical protein
MTATGNSYWWRYLGTPPILYIICGVPGLQQGKKCSGMEGRQAMTFHSNTTRKIK